MAGEYAQAKHPFSVAQVAALKKDLVGVERDFIIVLEYEVALKLV